jgi:hypothetical protein
MGVENLAAPARFELTTSAFGGRIRKGRGTKKVTHRTVPISKGLAARLKVAAAGRAHRAATDATERRALVVCSAAKPT